MREVASYGKAFKTYRRKAPGRSSTDEGVGLQSEDRDHKEKKVQYREGKVQNFLKFHHS